MDRRSEGIRSGSEEVQEEARLLCPVDLNGNRQPLAPPKGKPIPQSRRVFFREEPLLLIRRLHVQWMLQGGGGRGHPILPQRRAGEACLREAHEVGFVGRRIAEELPDVPEGGAPDARKHRKDQAGES